MNFQAVSVGQKLIENGVKGGYTDAAGDPTPSMASEIQFVDAAIGQMVEELEDQSPSPFDRHHHHRQARPIADRHQPLLPHSGTFAALNGTPPSAILAIPSPAVRDHWPRAGRGRHLPALADRFEANTLTAVGNAGSQREQQLDSARSSMALRSTPFLTLPACR